MANYNKLLKWAVPGLFLIVLLVNYLTSFGIMAPYTQAEVSALYPNLFAPANFTFSIWAVIYVGVIASLSLNFSFFSVPETLEKGYQQLIQPYFVEWMFFNILWNIAWTNNQILIALLAIVLYTRRLLQLMTLISGTPLLRQKPWLLKYPIGLHTGWLIAATFANLTTYVVSVGIDGVGTIGFWWAVAMMAASLATVTYFYGKYGNEAVMLPVLWALIGLIVQHNPGSDFAYASETLAWVATVFFLIGVSLYGYLFKLQTKQAK